MRPALMRALPLPTSKAGPFAENGPFASFHYRDFRYFCLGNFSTFNAGAMWNVAQGWLVLSMTNSPFMLGLISFVGNVPFVVFTLLGGAMADRMEKRKMLILAEVANLSCVLALGTLTATGLIRVWQVFAISLFSNAAMAFKGPARNSFVMELVERSKLMNAIALNSATINVTRILGPALGGVLVGLLGVAGTFYTTALLYLVALIGLTSIRTVSRSLIHVDSVWSQTAEGLRYVRRHEIVFPLISLMAVLTFVGLPYQTMLPVFARDVLNVGSFGLGLLSAVSGVGALVGSFVLAFLGNYRRRGKMLLGCAALFVISLALFSLATELRPSFFLGALLLMFALGASNVTYMTTTNALLQTSSREEFRGRVMGVFMLSFGLTPLGTLPIGAIADRVNAPFAVGVGAVVCFLSMVVVVSRYPKLRRLA